MDPDAAVYTFRTTAMSTAPPQAVFDVLCDLPANLDWSGERAEDDSYKLLSLDATEPIARVGTRFSSTGANFNGTFHDTSVVTELAPPGRFAYETDATLERKRGREWRAHFAHRYDIRPDGSGSRIEYEGVIEHANYVPYWLRWWMAPIFKPVAGRADKKQLENLARLAEERANA